MRGDKARPNSKKTIAHLEKICKQPYTKDNLKSNIIEFQTFDKHEVTLSMSNKQSDCGHPVKNISFDKLYSSINELVQRGEVVKTVDSGTSLEIFTYRATATFSNPMVRLSRGLVLHPPSRTVVTRPFVRFFEGNLLPLPVDMIALWGKVGGSFHISIINFNKQINVNLILIALVFRIMCPQNRTKSVNWGGEGACSHIRVQP